MSQRLNLAPIRTCKRRKARFYTIAEAEATLTVMKQFASGHRTDPHGMRVYPCGICKAFHLGHGEGDVYRQG